MKYNDLKERCSKIDWFHSIELPSDEGIVLITKGVVGLDHCSPDVITKRFGLPAILSHKTVLDVGTFDGIMAFEAEKRGAIVTAIDPLQGRKANGTDGFNLAKEALSSNVFFMEQSLEETPTEGRGYDLILLYGTLYHILSPIDHLQKAYDLCEEHGYVLIETAISKDTSNVPSWQFLHGHDGDETNFWYPNMAGLETVLKYIGFSQVELIWTDSVRATIRALK